MLKQPEISPLKSSQHVAEYLEKASTIAIVRTVSTVLETDPAQTDPRVQRVYNERRYHEQPMSAEEARRANQNNFNGLVYSATLTGPSVNPTIVLHPSRYLYLGAYQHALRGELETNQGGLEVLADSMSPRIANAGVYCVVETKAGPALLGQVKGKAIGDGEFHAALAAGALSAGDLGEPNPFLVAALRELEEEIGVRLRPDDLRIEPIALIVNELQTGNLMVNRIVRLKLDDVLEGFGRHTNTLLGQGQKLEALGVAELPVSGVALIPLDKEPVRASLTEWIATSAGLEQRVTSRKFRPHTVGLIQNPDVWKVFEQQIL